MYMKRKGAAEVSKDVNCSELDWKPEELMGKRGEKRGGRERKKEERRTSGQVIDEEAIVGEGTGWMEGEGQQGTAATSTPQTARAVTAPTRELLLRRGGSPRTGMKLLLL